MDSRRPRRAGPILVVAGIVVAVALVAVAFSRSGEETPERAIYGLAHDLEHAEVEGVCERLLPTRALPAATARAFGLATGTGGTAQRDWDAEHRRCVRELGRTGGFETIDFEEPRVRSVSRVRVQPQGGVTAAATALVALGGEAPTTVQLVEFRGKWRVVFEAR